MWRTQIVNGADVVAVICGTICLRVLCSRTMPNNAPTEWSGRVLSASRRVVFFNAAPAGGRYIGVLRCDVLWQFAAAPTRTAISSAFAHRPAGPRAELNQAEPPAFSIVHRRLWTCFAVAAKQPLNSNRHCRRKRVQNRHRLSLTIADFQFSYICIAHTVTGVSAVAASS